MELLIYLLYLAASHSFLLLFAGIFLAIGLFSIAHRMRQANSSVAPIAFALFFLCLLLLLFAVINLIRPHILDGVLIYKYGARATAKVVSREETSSTHNYQRVERFNVIYKTDDEKAVETYFETWDFNIYPSANSVRYPAVGQEFAISYLRSFPNTFIILTDVESEHTASVACVEILKTISEKKNKFEFDKKNPKFIFEYMEALGKGIGEKCGDHLMEELRQLGNSQKR